ncbi:hypothetical protein CPB86DRAFT_707007 [Serendipita vermifera]|nr:hypothetical protein CPB86DRAFT_707007 [Serendipita vermifera]
MNKNTATLRLTEPVIFLRTGSDSTSQRRRGGRPDYPPALLRGLLSLKIVKPTRIKSVDVVFEGVARTDWPDVGVGVGTRRMEIHEENPFLSLKIILFEGNQQGRSKTIGPGSIIGDRRSSLVEGVNHLALADEHTRGRKERRDAPNPEASQRGLLATRNGTEPPTLSSIREAPLRPRLSIGEGPAGTSSDPTIPTTARSTSSTNGK